MSFIEDYKQPLTFVVIVLLGRLLELKINTVQYVMGFQQVIMSCFLPALLLRSITALPLSELATSWQYPVVALLYSCFLMVCMQVILWTTGFAKLRQERVTLLLMFPGLAPGLTTLPHVTVSVAEMEPKTINGGQVGFADLGIKFFVLFVLFILALPLSRDTNSRNLKYSQKASRHSRTLGSNVCAKSARELCFGFLSEPVNFASFIGLVLLAAGPIRLEDLSIAGQAIERLSNCCAPAIFLLIGMKMKIFQKRQAVLFMLIVLRSGIGFLFAYFLSRTLCKQPNETMFWVFICNSSLSFWPYTHICRIGVQEDNAAHTMCQGLLEQAADDDSLSKDMRSCLLRLRNLLQAGDRDVASTLEEACLFARSFQSWRAPSSCISADTGSVSSGERLNDLVWDLENLLERTGTFDPTLALMALSVSTSWTMFSCTILALTPVDFWISTYALPAVGSAMVLVSVLGLVWTGRNLSKTMSPSSQEKEEPIPSDLSEFKSKLSERRQSIVSANARISVLEACEADLVLREKEAETLPSRFMHALCAQQPTAARRNSIAEYGLRRSLAKLAEDSVTEDLMPFSSSIEISPCLRQAAASASIRSQPSTSKRVDEGSKDASMIVGEEATPAVMNSAYPERISAKVTSMAQANAQKIGKEKRTVYL